MFGILLIFLMLDSRRRFDFVFKQKNSEGTSSGRSHGGGNRNKKLKTLEKFKSRNPFALKEKTRQEEVSRAKAEAKARRRLQALNAKRSS